MGNAHRLRRTGEQSRQSGDDSRSGRENEAGGGSLPARIDVSPKQLGYDVGCFIGIILKSAKDYPSALAKLESLDEVTEAYYTTGHYSIFIKVMCRSIDALQHVLINKIQTIDEIQSTETLIVLQNPIMRTIKPDLAFLIPYFSTGRSQRVHSVQYATLNKGGGLWQISLLSAAAPSAVPNM